MDLNESPVQKKRKLSTGETETWDHLRDADANESTDLKLAILSSLYPEQTQDTLLDLLISSDGDVAKASELLKPDSDVDYSPRKRRNVPDIQSSLRFAKDLGNSASGPASKSLTRKGKTLHLYTPEDVASHSPCTIVHNFLPSDLANALLSELLTEAPTFPRASFKLFDNIVQSPHSASFYVTSPEEAIRQKTEYLYNGAYLNDVRQITPLMQQASDLVQLAVNEAIKERIKTHYPGGKKLPYQSPKEWLPNAAFVNCYSGGKESVGYHSDQLTYLGPRAVIGSLSLGVAREFRVRKIIARDDHDQDANAIADFGGQIAIHLPHNSLLVMHAEMQEEWKHAIAPAQNITPHPIAGHNRVNVTYRWYRESLHPKKTPRCRCGVPCVLRCVQKKKGNRGRYMWMCHAGNNTTAEKGKDGCSFFQWAQFDDDGEPVWDIKAGKD